MSQTTKEVLISSNTNLEIITLLESVGLTKNQALVYLELVKRQSAEASILCDETGIKNSKIYGILSKLENLGLIVVETTKPKKYRVLLLEESLENLANVIKVEYETKIKTLDELKVRLSPLFDSITSVTEFALILKGQRHVLNHITTKLNTSVKSITFVSPNLKYYEMFKETLMELANEGITVQVGLHETKPLNLTDSQIEFIPMGCKLFYIIIDNNYLILITEWDDPDLIYAIVTSDNNLIHMSNNYLESPACAVDH
ncbi:MAG: TrmB family transcriptional regulator [Candidatus Hodarchaeales archaeon]